MPAAMRDPDFTKIISEPVERVTRFPDVHSGQASDVWLLETANQSWIVRASRFAEVPDMDFWVGCQHLFGIDPSNTDLCAVHDCLRPLSKIPVPRIERSFDWGGRRFFVVERLPGSVLRQFSELPLAGLQALGESMAQIHSFTRNTFGRLDRLTTYSADNWSERLIETMMLLVDRYYRDDARIQGELGVMCEAVRSMPPVTQFAPIMLDLDPTQFIHDDGRLTGMVDLEVYTFGPPAFELCMLEYLLDSEQGAAFADGYSHVRPFPNVAPVRRLYRYLGLLLAVQGRLPFEEWMNSPVIF